MKAQGASGLRLYIGDLHIHTVLSPCAQYSMAPTLIVEQAMERGIDFIAITDHNSIGNAEAVMQAAKGTSLTVWPGMELETKEEVHVVVLFDDLSKAQRWQDMVETHLPDIPNDEEAFGVQVMVNADNEIVRREQRRLLVASDLSIDQVFQEVSGLGGFCIPAHVDRPSYGLLETLGFVPPEIDAPVVEVSRNVKSEAAARRLPGIEGRTVIQSSDAHCIEDLGVVKTGYELEELTLQEFILACRGRDGRRVHWVDAQV